MKKFLLLLSLSISLLKINAIACEANFTWSTDGMTIHLDGSASTGDIASWNWFINGDLFSDAHPQTQTTVSDTGEYEICLAIQTADGCTDTLCQTVHVEQQNIECNASFTWSTDGFTINLDGSASTGQILHWSWYINGEFFSDSHPETHTTVSDTGEYEICLVIQADGGYSDTLCQTVHVEQQNGDCAAHFSWTTDGLIIHLNGSESTGDITSWNWFIDGDLFSDAGPETQTTVSDSGEYEICLVIQTGAGCIDTLCQTVHVEQQNIECNASFTWSVDGFTINLDGSASTGQILHWSWYINGEFFSDSHPETHTTVSDTGEYEICLIIQADGGCSDTLCQTVHVEQENEDCNASFTWSTDGFTINLDGSSSTGQILHWSWYINGDFFSDSHPETHTTVGESGTYEICLVIHADGDCNDTSCQEIVVAGFPGEGYDFKILPNDDGSITVQISSPENSSVNVLLSEISGRKIFERQQNVNAGSSQFVIAFGNTLSPGIYLISLVANNKMVKTEKVVMMK